MIELLSKESFTSLVSSPRSLILMTPAWSTYPKRVLKILEGFEDAFRDKEISIFTSTEDDPAKNSAMDKLLKASDLSLFPSIASGAGSLLACNYGTPVRLIASTYNMDQENIKQWVYESFDIYI